MADAFVDSRRLTGPNLFFASTGAVLETAPSFMLDAAREADWRDAVARARAALGWRSTGAVARRSNTTMQLAVAAPLDQLLTATSVNEWAWQRAVGMAWTHQPEATPIEPADDAAAIELLRRLAAAERRPRLAALVYEGSRRRLPAIVDDDRLTLGSGAGGQSWPLDALPLSDAVDWHALQAVPSVLVTGTNGKTTTARLLAAISREAGRTAGRCGTDGIAVGDSLTETGDYSGPDGARRVLRDPRVEIAVLETARGGLLRRGLALPRANVAVVTNVTADHFGEYGIDDLASLAEAKFVVARAVEAFGSRGLMVINADDPASVAHVESHARALAATTLGWFALDDDHPRLVAHRARGGATAGVRDGRLVLVGPSHGSTCDLGRITEMPLSLDGHAAYNVSNLLAAALAAPALGLPHAAIGATFARFGNARSDNPGRLQRWRLAGGIEVILDYAHNPAGLAGLLRVARAAHPEGRLLLLLGHAGNRTDDEIGELAATAASFDPVLVVLKEIPGMLRGRAPGDVPALLRRQLADSGIPPDRIASAGDETEAASAVLAAAFAGDLVVLPMHERGATAEVSERLDALRREDR